MTGAYRQVPKDTAGPPMNDRGRRRVGRALRTGVGVLVAGLGMLVAGCTVEDPEAYARSEKVQQARVTADPRLDQLTQATAGDRQLLGQGLVDYCEAGIGFSPTGNPGPKFVCWRKRYVLLAPEKESLRAEAEDLDELANAVFDRPNDHALRDRLAQFPGSTDPRNASAVYGNEHTTIQVRAVTSGSDGDLDIRFGRPSSQAVQVDLQRFPQSAVDQVGTEVTYAWVMIISDRYYLEK